MDVHRSLFPEKEIPYSKCYYTALYVNSILYLKVEMMLNVYCHYFCVSSKGKKD